MATTIDEIKALALLGANVSIDARKCSSDDAEKLAKVLGITDARVTIENAGLCSQEARLKIAQFLGPRVTFAGLSVSC